MFGSVATSTHSIDQYAPFVGDAAIESLRAAAAPLRGARVLYLSSPAASGAVRRLLQSSVPLLADLGLNIQWQQVRIAAEYVEMDRALRRALSGYPGWHENRESEWREFNQGNAQMFDEEFDIVVVHHSASVGLHAALTQLQGHPPPGVWLWHSHRDYRNAVPNAWSLIRQHADDFDASVYDYKPFIRDDAPTLRTFVVAPGVDPLSPSARPVSDEVRETILAQRGLNVNLPVVGQIVLSMRDDDPERVLDTFALVRQRRPDVQLVITNLVTDEPALAEKLNVLRQRALDSWGECWCSRRWTGSATWSSPPCGKRRRCSSTRATRAASPLNCWRRCGSPAPSSALAARSLRPCSSKGERRCSPTARRSRRRPSSVC